LTNPFQLFDLSVASNYLFKTRFPAAGSPVDLFFACQRHAPLAVEWEQVRPQFASRQETTEGASQFLLLAAGGCVMLRFANIADFYLWTDTIVCHLVDPAYDYLVEIYFLGTVMACWFELQGMPALHAAASVVNGRVVAFLSSNKGGKSSLAAALMRQGCPLLTDDILLVERREDGVFGRSGYPQMRMWPEQAAEFYGRAEPFSKVHPDYEKRRIPVDYEQPELFAAGRYPLARFYIPERYDAGDGRAEITITPVPPVEMVLTLAGYSFLFWLVEAIGLQPGRLKTLAQAVHHAPVRRLRYPSGVEHLAAVCQAILADI
jgi:hypothetical protein